jgi:inosine-uridine nucleoside N-ribohydrolase
VTPHAEFNAFADPDAAAQVFAGGWNEIIAVGLDVTHQTAISRHQWERIERHASGASELTRRIAERTFTERGMDGFYLHDPLAVAVALDDSLVSTEDASVDVRLDQEYRGRTTLAGAGTVRVATRVDAERFERLFAERLDLPVRVDHLTTDRTE